jgi:CRISPR/Cas system CSM-associated protein Csm3 (group 7 of RAMP superfamily)
MTYRTLFKGTLAQDSALHVGGTAQETVHAEPVARDGAGRPTLTGRGLAGALVATARKIYGQVPRSISAGLPGVEEAGSGSFSPMESVWRVFTSHPESPPGSEQRQSVGIRQATGAAATGALFDFETLPRGTRWPFLLEVDTHRGSEEDEQIAVGVLREWQRGRCWLGASAARGLGWCTLEGAVDVYRLIAPDDVDRWPDASEKLEKLLERLEARRIPLSSLDAKEPCESAWWYIELEGTISVGESLFEKESYGLDGLAVAGHGSAGATARWSDAFIKPDGQKLDAANRNFAPERMIVMTRKKDGGLEPFLPGAGLRGPLRHAFSRLERRKGKSVRDPNLRSDTDGGPQDLVAPIFGGPLGPVQGDGGEAGSEMQCGTLLVRDAYLEEGSQWRAAWLERHAEDEFSASTFESAKFDSVVLLAGTFGWKMVLEGPDKKTLEDQLTLLTPVLEAARSRHLPVGGLKWSGAGWAPWAVQSRKIGQAGQDSSEYSEPAEGALAPTAGAEQQVRHG